MSMLSLAVELDLTTSPPSVKNVTVRTFATAKTFHGDHVYETGPYPGPGPWAALAEVTASSSTEAYLAIKGVIESDDFAWVREYPGVVTFLRQLPVL